MEEDDLIRIDIPERVLEIIGVKGKELPGEEVERDSCGAQEGLETQGSKV